MLLSGSDVVKVERIKRTLNGIGVNCEIRHQNDTDDLSEVPTYPELWVKKDEDFDTAMLVLTRAGAVGRAYWTR